jgi:hypothetical protein
MEVCTDLEEALLDRFGERAAPGLSLRHEISRRRMDHYVGLCGRFSRLPVLPFQALEQFHLGRPQFFAGSHPVQLEVVALAYLNLNRGLDVAKGVLRFSVTGPRKSVANELEAMLLAGGTTSQ